MYFNHVARADSARSKMSDDIPLARRSSPSRKARTRKIILIALALITASCLVSIWFTRTTYLKTLSTATESSSVDQRLLGHFPYEEASKADLVEIYPGLEIHKETYKSLRRMRAKASADGVRLVLLSGYRSISLQKQIFYGRKSARNQIAIERAKVSAPPGYSEHSTGYAIDLGDAERRETDLEVEFESTRAFKWLQENAAKYHFVLSFPRGNPQKVSYEPWHWRFEGTVEALEEFKAANEWRRIQE